MTENTDRRSFLRQLSMGLSAAIFTPHIIAATWKDTLKYGKVNPAYLNAPFECSYILGEELYEIPFFGYFQNAVTGEIKKMQFPKRFRKENGQYIEVLP